MALLSPLPHHIPIKLVVRRYPTRSVFPRFRTDILSSQHRADRTLVPMAKMPDQAHVVCPGWVISSVVLLPDEPGQGTFVLDTKPRDFL
jgi:hypothetical protein